MMIDNGKFGLGFSHIWETYLGETYIYIYQKLIIHMNSED